VHREIAAQYAAGSDPLQLELLAIHLCIHRTLRNGMIALAARHAAGEKTGDSSPLLRTLRQEAALCRSLAATLKPVEVGTAESDQWAEFDNPLERFLKPRKHQASD